MTSMQERIEDYLEFGVENIWLIDPRRRKAFWTDANGMHKFTNAILTAPGTQIEIELSAVWLR